MFVESRVSIILGTLTQPNLKYVPGIEEACDFRNIYRQLHLTQIVNNGTYI